MNEKLELAWLAGLIDGEGSFGIYKRQVMLRINLVERDKFVLEKVQKIAGGRLNYNSRLNERNPNWSNQWCWTLGRHKDLYSLCKRIYPYLVLKRGECKKMMDSIEQKVKKKYGI